MDGLPRPGERLAHYRIVDKLGAGGMGEVYRAHDEHLHRDVAIKVLPTASFDDPAARARLVREARAAAALNHPYICTVHEVGEASGQTYIAMELVEGQTLSSRLATGPFPTEQVVRFGVQLAEALGHAHDRGVLHRDLKTANVIATPAGRVKVLDFGLAKRLSVSELTTQFDATAIEHGTVAGTLAYMAPEQLRGQGAQASTDVWALGVVLYEMAHGVRPFQGKTGFELSAAILSEGPSPCASSIPAGLQSVIARCLEKEPGQRYQTGSEVCAALEMLQTRGDSLAEISDTRPIVPAPPVRPASRGWLTRRRALWLGAAAIAVVAGVSAWKLWPTNVLVRSMAVLPFRNAQADEAVDHLCDGITEGLIRQIAEIPSLRVIPLSRVLHYKGQGIDARTAGRDLRVEYVLSGTLTRQGAQLKVEVELIEVASGTRLWNHTYERDTAALLNVQDEIGSAILDEGLRVRLSTAERRRLVRHPTTDAEAYDLYMQARNLQRRGTEDEYIRSKELLEKAIIRDQKFALAYGAMSGIYAMMVTDGLVRPTDAWPLVSKYLRQAEAADPDFPDSNAFAHAYAFLFNWDWAAAEQARRLSMQTESNSFDPDDLRSFAIERWALGRPDEALEMVRRTRQLDPLNAELASVEADYLVHNGQLDAAVALYKQSISMEPANAAPYFGLAEAYHRQRRFEDAIDLRRQAHAIAGDDSVAEAFARAKGKGEEGYRQSDRLWVQHQLAELKTRSATKYVSPLDFARAYAQLGESDSAFRHLEAAFNDRSPGLVFLNVDRAFDSVRTDPRFLVAVRRVGLPEPRGRTP